MSINERLWINDDPDDTDSDEERGFASREVKTQRSRVGYEFKDTISETGSPTQFVFAADHWDSIHQYTTVLVSNPTTAAVTEQVTVRWLDGPEDKRGVPASERLEGNNEIANKTIETTVPEGGTAEIDYRDVLFGIANRDVLILVETSGTDLDVLRTDTTVLGTHHETAVVEGGAIETTDHYGRLIRRTDPIDGATEYPHGVTVDGRQADLGHGSRYEWTDMGSVATPTGGQSITSTSWTETIGPDSRGVVRGGNDVPTGIEAVGIGATLAIDNDTSGETTGVRLYDATNDQPIPGTEVSATGTGAEPISIGPVAYDPGGPWFCSVQGRVSGGTGSVESSLSITRHGRLG